MTDFIIYADEDWPQPFVYQDKNGTGIDIAGADILFVAKAGSTTIKKSTTEASITIADQGVSIGEFIVSLTGADTTGKGGETFEYEIKLTLSGVARVIYPSPGSTASFSVLTSLTDGITDELMREEREERAEEPEPVSKLKRVPKLPHEGT